MRLISFAEANIFAHFTWTDYSLAQASRAILPKDAGGPFGQRIGVTVGGSQSWALRVSAFMTKRNSSTDFNRYSIVVLNWNDSASTTWNPQPVKATIEFRGVQVRVIPFRSPDIA